MRAAANPRERRTRTGQAVSLARSVLSGVAFAALIGVSVFGFLAFRSVSVERAEPDRAEDRFAAIREQFSGTEPLLRIEPDGRVVRRQADIANHRPAHRLRVLAYRASLRRVVQADMPFWFLKAKGPAIRFALRDTGLDLEGLGVTPSELQGYGVTLVLDTAEPGGDRLLVWTE